MKSKMFSIGLVLAALCSSAFAAPSTEVRLFAVANDTKCHGFCDGYSQNQNSIGGSVSIDYGYGVGVEALAINSRVGADLFYTAKTNSGVNLRAGVGTIGTSAKLGALDGWQTGDNDTFKYVPFTTVELSYSSFFVRYMAYSLDADALRTRKIGEYTATAPNGATYVMPITESRTDSAHFDRQVISAGLMYRF